MTDRDDRAGAAPGGPHGRRGDEVLRPDAVSPGDRHDGRDHDRRDRGASESSDGPAGATGSGADGALDRLAERAVASVLDVLRRVTKLAGAVTIFVVVACVGGFLLGLAAFDGGGRGLWIAIGGLGATWAVGTALAALWRLRVIRRGGAELVGEVRALLTGDPASRRTVIETVEAPDGRTSIVARSRDLSGLRDLASSNPGGAGRLAFALASVTRVPAMLVLAVVIGLAFVGLSLIFLVAIAL